MVLSKPGTLAQRVRQFAAANGLLQPADRLLLAISGGPDSVALLHLLLELGYRPALAHVNFGLRGADADADEEFVRLVGRELNLTVHAHRVDPKSYAAQKKVSLQVAARRLRYAFFDELVQAHAYTAVATAHHRNDAGETVLYNLLRGKSFSVLPGIPLRRGIYVRPLLATTKQELVDYLQAHNLPYRIDASNLEAHYDRNYIRLQVMPALAHLAGDPAALLTERAELYSLQLQLLHQVLGALTPQYVLPVANGYTIQLERLLQTKPAHVAQLWLLYWMEMELELEYNAARQALQLMDAQTGRHTETETWVLLRDRDTIAVSRTVEAMAVEEIALSPGLFQYNAVTISVKIFAGSLPSPMPANPIYLDAGTTRGPLRLRPWQPGDYLKPLGLRGSKKVSDILTDAKIPAAHRNQAFVLADNDGVVYVQGYRIAERVKITPATKTIWEIRFS